MSAPPKQTGSQADSGASAPDPPAETEASRAYRVQLPVFEGPLDLLLHLIQQHELDILDIPIGFISEKYVEYIQLMQEVNIDLASEYLVMAATLAHIKSKMLLPSVPEDQEEEQEAELDPRADLVRRLLEYQKYKLAAEQLSAGPLLGRDTFSRGIPAPSVDGPAPLSPISLFKLLDAFNSILKRAKQGVEHQIDVDRFSISDRINQLTDLLNVKQRLSFEELFTEDQSRPELIVTFLALLEMTRLRLIRLYQDAPLAPIVIELAVTEGSSDEGSGDAPPGPEGTPEAEPAKPDFSLGAGDQKGPEDSADAEQMTAEPATPASIPPESGPALRREQISPPAEELFPSAEPSQGELGLAVEPESVESSGDAMNEDRPSDRFREPETPDSGESELEQNPVGPVPREAEPE